MSIISKEMLGTLHWWLELMGVGRDYDEYCSLVRYCPRNSAILALRQAVNDDQGPFRTMFS
jgi:hypothetical protein